MSELVSVWGTCDGADILFRNVGEGTWETIVPADLTDGQYIVEIWGMTYSGYTIYATAILYLCDSRCVSMKFINDGIFVKIRVNAHRFCKKEDNLQLKCSRYTVRILERLREKVVIKCV